MRQFPHLRSVARLAHIGSLASVLLPELRPSGRWGRRPRSERDRSCQDLHPLRSPRLGGSGGNSEGSVPLPSWRAGSKCSDLETAGWLAGSGPGVSRDFRAEMHAFYSKEELRSGPAQRGECAHPSTFTRACAPSFLDVEGPVTGRHSIDSVIALKEEKRRKKHCQIKHTHRFYHAFRPQKC